MASQKSPAPALLQITSSLRRTEVRLTPRNLRALDLTIFALPYTKIFRVENPARIYLRLVLSLKKGRRAD